MADGDGIGAPSGSGGYDWFFPNLTAPQPGSNAFAMQNSTAGSDPGQSAFLNVLQQMQGSQAAQQQTTNPDATAPSGNAVPSPFSFGSLAPNVAAQLSPAQRGYLTMAQQFPQSSALDPSNIPASGANARLFRYAGHWIDPLSYGFSHGLPASMTGTIPEVSQNPQIIPTRGAGGGGYPYYWNGGLYYPGQTEAPSFVSTSLG